MQLLTNRLAWFVTLSVAFLAALTGAMMAHILSLTVFLAPVTLIAYSPFIWRGIRRTDSRDAIFALSSLIWVGAFLFFVLIELPLIMMVAAPW